MKDPSETAPSKTRASHGLHLACRECQRKKIKCDRLYPCGQCTRGGISCVPSTRKPRAKVGVKAADVELRQRIAKLEKLVESFQGEEGKDGAQSGENTSSSPPEDVTLGLQLHEALGNRSSSSPSNTSALGDAPPTRKASKYIGGAFWSSLTSEVKALADAFEDEDEDEDDVTSPDGTPESAPYALDAQGLPGTQGYELIFCPPGVLYVMPGVSTEPDEAMSKMLLESYLQHVEPIHKLFHVPTLRAFIQDGASYLGRPPDAPCNKALKASIHYAGVNSLTEDECQSYWGKPLEEVSTQFRRTVDIALYQADPLNTNELSTVQALTNYISAIRILDPSRRAWSMVGLVARIARAMSLHRELPGEQPFMGELRRRAWYSIVFLDCYASIDRGSEPAIHPDSYSRQMCTNCNDADFDEHSTSIPSREGELTDMSAALVAHEGSQLSLRLAIAEDNANFPWQRRLEMAYEFQRKIHERHLRYCDPTNPAHGLILGTGQACSNSLMLRAVRPIQCNTTPPPVDSPWVMALAVNILRHSNHLWESLYGRWRRMPWIPWHAMAVTLAALCSVRDTEEAKEAWTLVDLAMSRYGDRIADSANGMLWKPLEKLHRKAAAFRDGEEVHAFHAFAISQAPQPKPTEETWTNPIFAQSALAQPQAGINMDPTTGMPLDVLSMNMPLPAFDSVFDFPPEMQAALPNDNSWLDWEAMMKDMDDLKADEMQWV